MCVVPSISKRIFLGSRKVFFSNLSSSILLLNCIITQEFRFYYKMYPGIFHGILLAIWAHFTNHTDYGTNRTDNGTNCTDYGYNPYGLCHDPYGLWHHPYNMQVQVQ